DDAGGDFGDLLVQQRLAARNGDHRRAAFVDRRETLVDRQATIEDFPGVIDLAAARASEVAAEQRLEHQDERVAPAPGDLLAHDVGADTGLLQERDGHRVLSPQAVRPTSARLRSKSAGRRNSTFSSMPGSVATSMEPSARSASITPSTSVSGAEA